MKELALRQFNLFFCFLLLLFPVVNIPVAARSIDEINNDISSSQKELEQIKAELDKASKELANSQAKKDSSQSEIKKVEAELQILESNSLLISLQKKELENELNLKSLEKEEKETLQDNQMISTYISWKTEDVVNAILGNSGDVVKNLLYYDFMTKETIAGVKTLAGEIAELNKQQVDYEAQIQLMEKEMSELEAKKIFWQEVVKQNEDAIAKANQDMSSFRAKNGSLQQELQQLFNELLEKDTGSTNSGTQPLVSGELYFTGSVINSPGDPMTDAFGHGLGLSQFGAYGAAANGWSADQIVTYYYTNTRVEIRAGINISVSGYGTMDMETYVSGLGEVPDRACGSLAQIDAWRTYANESGWAGDDARRNKYVIDNTSTIWDCWPEESIKAQIMAARSYAATSAQPICTSASCQVYKGGKNKAWAAWETKDKYIISNGPTAKDQIIRAYYSSYNNNGWGSADHDTIWPDSRAGGKSNPYSYLKAVADSAFTYKAFNRTSWRSNSYTIVQLNDMINWCSIDGNCSSASWIRSNVKDRIGKLVAITTNKDASGRVKKVILQGEKGSATMSGQYFRSVFNLWVDKIRPKGVDKIQGITFTISQAQ